MLISEVARKSGLTKDTVRYYTQLEIIRAEDKEAGSRIYADYPDSVLELLDEVRLSKSAGFTLSEIREGFALMREGKLTNRQLVEVFEVKLKEVEAKKAELKEVEKMLKFKINAYSQANPSDPAKPINVNEHTTSS